MPDKSEHLVDVCGIFIREHRKKRVGLVGIGELPVFQEEAHKKNRENASRHRTQKRLRPCVRGEGPQVHKRGAARERENFGEKGF